MQVSDCDCCWCAKSEYGFITLGDANMLLIGDKYTSIETRVPHRYNVLDWFKVTHAWAEKDSFSGLIRWKFRYEKLDFQRTGWWARAEAVPNKLCILEDICRACGKQFPHVYRNSFICFNAQCPAFFKVRYVSVLRKSNQC